MKPEHFEDALEEPRIIAAIQAEEARTSGEIRVFVSSAEPADILAEARREFRRLGMTRTPLRNGVLLYFAPKIRKFAVIGDEGIHSRCGEAFWTAVAGDLESRLKSGQFQEAVLSAVARAGAELARHFPKHPGDRNDLPDGIARD